MQSNYVHLDNITMAIVLYFCCIIAAILVNPVNCGSVSSKDGNSQLPRDCNNRDQLRIWPMNLQSATIRFDPCVQSGIITSPNYPDPYPEGINNFLSIEPDDPQVFKLIDINSLPKQS